MKPTRIRVLVLLVSIALLTSGASTDCPFRDLPPSLTEPDPATRAHLVEAFGKLPLYFVENQGQVDDEVAYYIQGSDKTIYFSPAGVTFALTASPQRAAVPGARTASLRAAAMAFSACSRSICMDCSPRWDGNSAVKTRAGAGRSRTKKAGMPRQHVSGRQRTLRCSENGGAGNQDEGPFGAPKS